MGSKVLKPVFLKNIQIEGQEPYSSHYNAVLLAFFMTLSRLRCRLHVWVFSLQTRDIQQRPGLVSVHSLPSRHLLWSRRQLLHPLRHYHSVCRWEPLKCTERTRKWSLNVTNAANPFTYSRRTDCHLVCPIFSHIKPGFLVLLWSQLPYGIFKFRLHDERPLFLKQYSPCSRWGIWYV